MANVVAGARAVVKLGLQQILGRSRRRRYERRSGSFLFKSPYGLRFKLDPHETVDRHIAVEGIYDGRFLEFIESVLPQHAVMLDVGANIGNHALFLHPNCSAVHCFEPNPRALRRLEENIALNDARNIVVHRFGLGDSDRFELFIDNDTGNLGGSRFVREALASTAAKQLPIRSGDQIVSELDLPRLDYIKVDVESFEPEVFRGLRRTIARHRPIVSFEHHGDKVGNEVFEDICRHLPGYRIFELTYAPVGSSLLKRTAWHFAHGGRPELTEVLRPGSRSYENLVAIPAERCAALNYSLR